MWPWSRRTSASATSVATYLEEHRLGPLRLGTPLEEALALLGPPDDEMWAGPPIHWLDWDDLKVGFQTASDGREVLEVLMLEPAGAVLRIPPPLGATGAWPERGTSLEDFVTAPGVVVLPLVVFEEGGLSLVVCAPDGERGPACLTRRRPFRARPIETVVKGHTTTTRARPAAGALFATGQGFFRFLLPG
jgi:hypothetical protein